MMILTALGLCLAATLAGAGALKICRPGLSEHDILYLAPAICVSLWSLYVACVALARIPVGHAWVPLVSLTLASAVYGALRLTWREIREALPGIALALIAAVIASYPFARYGYETFLGSPAQDGWSYVAFAEYLWKYPRGTEGGLAPLYQYASHLSGTRFASPGLLGVLSVSVGAEGDPQRSVGYLLCLAFYAEASACVFFSGVAGMSIVNRFGFTLITVASTWSIFLLTMNNFDNALFIYFMPAVLGVIMGVRLGPPANGIVLGALLASSAVVYPELFGILLVVSAIWLAERLFKSSSTERKVLVKSLLVPSVAVLGIAAIALYSEMWQFLVGQLGTVAADSRPGWDVAGFLPAKRLPLAFFGLSPTVMAHSSSKALAAALCVVLLACTIAGLIEQYRKGSWAALATFALLTTGLSYFCFIKSYGYAAYKVDLAFWWLVAYLIVEGGSTLGPRLAWWAKWPAPASHGPVVVVTLGVVSCCLLASRDLTKGMGERTITHYAEVAQIATIVAGRPVLAVLPDAASNLWAMYFLRDEELEYSAFEGYPAQSHVLPLMNRSRHFGSGVGDFILTGHDGDVASESQTRRVAWQNAKYRLVEPLAGDDALIVGLSNPNGVERWDGKLGFWVDSRPAVLRIQAARAGTALISAEIVPGPSMPESKRREVHFRAEDGIETIIATDGAGLRTFAVAVHTGENRFSLWVARTSKVLASLPNGDARELLLGLRNLDVKLTPLQP